MPQARTAVVHPGKASAYGQSDNDLDPSRKVSSSITRKHHESTTLAKLLPEYKFLTKSQPAAYHDTPLSHSSPACCKHRPSKLREVQGMVPWVLVRYNHEHAHESRPLKRQIRHRSTWGTPVVKPKGSTSQKQRALAQHCLRSAILWR